MRCFFLWELLALVACSASLSAEAAEYCLRPDKEDGTQAKSIVCCSTLRRWEGWRDNSTYWARITRFQDPMLEGYLRMSVEFVQSNCGIALFSRTVTKGSIPVVYLVLIAIQRQWDSCNQGWNAASCGYRRFRCSRRRPSGGKWGLIGLAPFSRTVRKGSTSLVWIQS